VSSPSFTFGSTVFDWGFLSDGPVASWRWSDGHSPTPSTITSRTTAIPPITNHFFLASNTEAGPWLRERTPDVGRVPLIAFLRTTRREGASSPLNVLSNVRLVSEASVKAAKGVFGRHPRLAPAIGLQRLRQLRRGLKALLRPLGQ